MIARLCSIGCQWQKWSIPSIHSIRKSRKSHICFRQIQFTWPRSPLWTYVPYPQIPIAKIQNLYQHHPIIIVINYRRNVVMEALRLIFLPLLLSKSRANILTGDQFRSSSWRWWRGRWRWQWRWWPCRSQVDGDGDYDEDDVDDILLSNFGR